MNPTARLRKRTAEQFVTRLLNSAPARHGKLVWHFGRHNGSPAVCVDTVHKDAQQVVLDIAESFPQVTYITSGPDGVIVSF